MQIKNKTKQVQFMVLVWGIYVLALMAWLAYQDALLGYICSVS